MIVVEHKPYAMLVAVAGEFTLKDYREFEENVLYEMRFHGKPALLFDLTEMLGYTLDLVWEEIKFTKAHHNEFGKIAVVTTDQWTTWATWLARLFVDGDVQVFESSAEAEQWLQEEAVS